MADWHERLMLFETTPLTVDTYLSALTLHARYQLTHWDSLIVAVADVPKLPGFTLEERHEWFATGRVGPVRIDLLFTANPLSCRNACHSSAATRHRLAPSSRLPRQAMR